MTDNLCNNLHSGLTGNLHYNLHSHHELAFAVLINPKQSLKEKQSVQNNKQNCTYDLLNTDVCFGCRSIDVDGTNSECRSEREGVPMVEEQHFLMDA